MKTNKSGVSEGQEYVEHTCAREFEKIITERFPGQPWMIDGSQYKDFWRMSNFPEKVRVQVLQASTGTPLCEVDLLSEPYITKGKYGARYINVRPVGILFIDIKESI